MPVAPSEQFTPTTRGSACSTEIQKASTVWPDRFRPLRSTAVKEIQSESLGATSRAATSAAVALRVSKIVSTRRMSPPAEPADLLCVGVSYLIECGAPVGRVVHFR